MRQYIILLIKIVFFYGHLIFDGQLANRLLSDNMLIVTTLRQNLILKRSNINA